jgi:cystathionine gamma-lyase
MGLPGPDTDLAGARRFLGTVQIFALADSLGIGDSLVRLSVGVGDVEDLRDDLSQALAAL